MKSTLALGALLTGLLTLNLPGTSLLAQEKKDPEKKEAKTITVVGELVDTKCYAGMGARGGDHQECATKCAQDGIPVAVLDEKGEMYVILFPAPFFAGYMAQTVRVTGRLHEPSHGLLIKSFEVKAGETWKAVELPKGMM